MAEVDFLRNEIADPQVAHQVVTEITEVAARASAAAREVLACTILDEGMHFEIEVEVPGWTDRRPSPLMPRRARFDG